MDVAPYDDSKSDELVAAQAEQDAALMQALKVRMEERAAMTPEEREALDGPPLPEPEAMQPQNRAQRRAMVKTFAANLKVMMPQPRPVPNPTIVPKSKRRRK